jgi:hypothetical protein
VPAPFHIRHEDLVRRFSGGIFAEKNRGDFGMRAALTARLE